MIAEDFQQTDSAEQNPFKMFIRKKQPAPLKVEWFIIPKNVSGDRKATFTREKFDISPEGRGFYSLIESDEAFDRYFSYKGHRRRNLKFNSRDFSPRLVHQAEKTQEIQNFSSISQKSR